MNRTWRAHLEFVEAFSERAHLVVPVATHQFAEGTDELVIHHAVHVDLLVLMLEAGQSTNVRVRDRLDQTVTCERFFVWVCCTQTTVTIWHFACDTGLYSLPGWILLTELAADASVHLGDDRRAVVSVGMVGVVGVVNVVWVIGERMRVAGSGRAATGATSTGATAAAEGSYGPANGGVVGPLRLQAAALSGRVGATERGLLKAINDILQSHIALQALQASVIQRDDVTTRGALKSRDGLEGLAGGTVRNQDAVGAVKAQAVGAGQEKGVFKQLQTDWAGQLRLQCFHLQLNQSKGDINSHKSWPVTCKEKNGKNKHFPQYI